MAVNNKSRGNTYELQVIAKLQPYYNEKLYSTRNISTLLDGKKVDISTENYNNDMNINYQVKSTVNNPNYIQILDSMPDNNKLNVIINKRTKKSDSGRFMNIGEIAVMKFDDYLKMLQAYNNINKSITVTGKELNNLINKGEE